MDDHECDSKWRGHVGRVDCGPDECVVRAPTGVADPAWRIVAVVPCSRDPVPPIGHGGDGVGISTGTVAIAVIGVATWRALRRRKTSRDSVATSNRIEVPSRASPKKRRRVEIPPEIARIVAESGARVPLVIDADRAVDLSKCPHVLVAGASGSGKSVAIHAMIAGLVAAGRADVWVCDPKRVEGGAWRGTVSRVETDPGGIVEALGNACDEMERRYRTMEQDGVRGWKGRQLVVIVDEFGDLMLGDHGKTVEKRLVRIAQLGRAAAVHLIIATQRPCGRTVSPLIKANVPARLALRTASAVDSRVIGVPDAHELEGSGHGIWSVDEARVRAPYFDPYNPKTE